MNKKVILCVDDEKVLIKSLKEEILRSFGYKYIIKTAEHPLEALDIVKEIQNENLELALVIADYIMPDMKGDELLEAIHKNNPLIVKVMLTGQASLEGVINAINNASLFKFIEKPWQPDELKQVIQDAIVYYETITSSNRTSDKSPETDNCINVLKDIQEPLSNLKAKISSIDETLYSFNRETHNDNLEDKAFFAESISEINIIIQKLNPFKSDCSKEEA